MEAQDPRELFDLYTRDGAPLGVAKPRAEVHRDGDWHRSVHVWIWSVVRGEPAIVLQRRSAAKDTWPRALDVAVAGHVRAGETIAATLREAEEEIGLAVRPEDLVRLGLRRRADRRPGVNDNELQEIFARMEPAEILALRPSPAELESLVAVPLRDAAAVLCDGGEADGFRLVIRGDRGELVEERIVGSELVAAPDGYWRAAFASVAEVIAGRAPRAWEIG
jgi:isopentenyldiphosphate isomerase